MKQDFHKVAPLSPKELKPQTFATDEELSVSNFYQLFHINRLEDVVHTIKFPLPPQRKTVFDFLFLTEGHSVRSKGLQVYEFSKNTFFFSPALQISTHKYLSPDVEGYFCHFDAEIFNHLFPHAPFYEAFTFWHFSGDPLVEIPDSLREPVLNILNRLLHHYQTSQLLPIHQIPAYLLALFNELNLVRQTAVAPLPNAAHRTTEKFKHLLARHIYATSKVTDYAAMLSITADYLNKCVKATTGKTAQDLLADMLILEAKVLLKQTNLSISDISFTFSETNPSDFSRFFKARTGITPKAYRFSQP